MEQLIHFDLMINREPRMIIIVKFYPEIVTCLPFGETDHKLRHDLVFYFDILIIAVTP